MGVDITQYLFVGIKLDYKKYENKIDEDDENGILIDRKYNDYISVIIDGMDGQYIYLGHIIEETEEWGNLQFCEKHIGCRQLLYNYHNEIEKTKLEIEPFLLKDDMNLVNEVDIFYIRHYS